MNYWNVYQQKVPEIHIEKIEEQLEKGDFDGALTLLYFLGKHHGGNEYFCKIECVEKVRNLFINYLQERSDLLDHPTESVYEELNVLRSDFSLCSFLSVYLEFLQWVLRFRSDLEDASLDFVKATESYETQHKSIRQKLCDCLRRIDVSCSLVLTKLEPKKDEKYHMRARWRKRRRIRIGIIEPISGSSLDPHFVRHPC